MRQKIVFFLTLFVCFIGSAAANQRDKLRILVGQTPQMQLAAVVAAQRQGFFLEEGLEVELVSNAGFQAQAGSFDIALVDASQLIDAAASGSGLRAFMAYTRYAPYVVATKEASFDGLDALASSGRILHPLSLFGLPYLVALEFLSGWQLADSVQIAQSAAADVFVLPLSDSLFAFTQPEDAEFVALTRLAGLLFAAHQLDLTNHTALFFRFVKAMRKALLFVAAQPSYMVGLTADIWPLSYTEEQKQIAWRHVAAMLSLYGSINSESLAYTAQRMHFFRLIPQQVHLNRLVFNLN